MASSRQPRKPTGTNGFLTLSATPTGATAEFQPIEFPTIKPEIEQLVASNFLRLAPEAGAFPIRDCELVLNPEADLDFTLLCADKVPRKLELMEIAPLEHLSGSYAKAPETYKPFDFARYIVNKIHGKSKKYGLPKETELHLLVYVTAWQFLLSESTIALIQYWTQVEHNNFAGVYLYMPISKDEGICRLLAPTPLEHWQSFDPNQFRENVVQNLSPLECRTASDGQGATFFFGPKHC